MMPFLSLLTTLHLAAIPHPTPALAVAPPDSIGVELRGGQRFVRHRVAGGETLFSIARRYRVALDQLTAANPQVAGGLAIGAVVLVPRQGGKAAGSKAPDKASKADKAKPAAATTAAATTAAAGSYTVRKGETLFAIARKLSLTPDELIKLNKLPADGAVRVGQQLLTRSATAAPAPAAPAAPTEAPRPALPAPDPAKPAEVATVTPALPVPAPKEKEKDAAPAKEEAPTRASEVVNRVTETGLGAGIPKGDTIKYLALHRNAPTGTIMQVKNQMNNRSVYVRVIGKLPDTGENANILVRLSPRAVQKLGTPDAKFRVETSYIP